MVSGATVLLLLSVFKYMIDLHDAVTEKFASIPKITQVWETKPIISIYVADAEKGGFCNSGYESVWISHDFALASVSEGPCGCAQNSMSLHSTNGKCPADLEESELCMSMSGLPALPSPTFKGGNICIKRGSFPSATYIKENYRARPHPDFNGNCPTGHKACGAICVPASSQCPITNLLILPTNESAPVGQGWESAGASSSDNSILYVRRNQTHELPIVDIVARLTEMTVYGSHVRGQCYEGPVQVFKQPLVSDPSHRWSYTAQMPPVCDVVDPRYQLVDSVDIETHFLHNLQSFEPTCRAHQLYALSDPRYQPASDPDYLNSGVQCDTTPTLPCVRGPYQPTNCAAEDDICDGVVHQNICGAYAHAVRSALSGSSATLGLYFAREIEWSDDCIVSKEFVFREALSVFSKVAWAYCLILMFCVVLGIKYVNNMLDKHDCYDLQMWLAFSMFWLILNWRKMSAIRESGCTDPFTADVLFSELSSRIVKCLALNLVVIIWLAIISCIVPSRTAESELWPLSVPPQARSSYPRRRARNSATVTASSTTATILPATHTPAVPNGRAADTPTTSTAATAATAAIHDYIPSIRATPVAVQIVPVGRGAYQPLLHGDEMV